MTTACIPDLTVEPGLDPDGAMARTRQGARAGYVDLRPHVAADFRPTLDLPAGPYLLRDVDLGADLRGVAPRDARVRIADAGRSPLTLEEGVAVLLAHPGILRAVTCFQMLGSGAGDRTVASLWVTREGRPRLGWCWEGNPHSWLGAASCSGRTPADGG